MSREELEPMDRELAALLAVKKSTPEPGDDVRERVLTSVLVQAGAIVAVGAASSGAGARFGFARQVVMAHPLAAVVGALAVGTSIGALAIAPRLSQDRVVYVDRIVLASPSVAPPPVAPTPILEPALTVRPHESVVRAPPPKTDGALDSQRLASERALLDIARAALSRGEAATAIDAAKRHADEFPNGQLAEERETILIRSLVQVGNTAEARARATNFHARFPESIFGRTIDAAIGTIP